MKNPPNHLDKLEYRTLQTEDDFNQCTEIQRNVFNLPDTHIVSPDIFRLMARNTPPIGIAAGVFVNAELIGYTISFATFSEKSVYGVMMGIKEKYQNKIFGYKLLLQLKELSIARNLETIYCIFDPLDVKLARLYISGLGFTGVHYETEADIPGESDSPATLPVDKLLVKWELCLDNTISKINGQHLPPCAIDCSTCPVATHEYLPELPAILVEIPDNFNLLAHTNTGKALEMRMKARKIFTEYINLRQYTLTGCITQKGPDIKKSFYLLEKK